MKRNIILACLIAACAPLAAHAQTPPQRIRGDIATVDGQTLQVKARSGETLTIKLADNYAVTAVTKADPKTVVPGAFVGIASMPQPDGSQSALEVLVFPESGRGSNEGHYPSDVQPGSMMTNATIAEVVSIDKARKLTLKYKDGEKTIIVPLDTPVVTFEPGDKSMVKPGAHIILTASKQADGSLTAARVLVGKDGLVPPM